MSIHKSPIEEGVKFEASDIVVSEESRLYKLVLRYRGHYYGNGEKVGCRACCFGEVKGSDSRCTLMNNPKLKVKTESGEVKKLNTCFQFSDRLLDDYFVSFEEIEGGV